MPTLETLLRERLGFPGFRPGQAEVVEHVVETGDALVVMPTGAGKSLCYQLPALALGGVAVVVSPLIALMKDQVEGLAAKGVRATLVNSTVPPEARRQRLREVQEGRWELVFVAPERFTPFFVKELGRAPLRLFAVDEAHCLSQWGHDFRPDYLRLGAVREALGRPRTIALTATATPRVQEDIARSLGIDDARRFVQGFDRPNLRFEVMNVSGLREKEQVLPALVPPGPTLVYAATRKNVERAASVLQEAGVSCLAYHAGLELDERNRVQDAFMSGEVPVVVATNAFGMGVDKKDVRTIVHWDLPGTVEAYYQEVGRAGRDGKKSRVILLYREEDRRTQEFFVNLAHPPADWVHRVWEELNARGENPVFLTLEDLARCLPDDGTERAAGSCLYVLQREGYVRRIAPTERPGLVRFLRQLDETRGIRATVWNWLVDRQQGDAPVGLWPDRVAEELELSREQVTAALRGLESRGCISYTAPERAGGVELLRPGEPLRLDEAAMRARRAQELEKLQKMVDYGHAACRRRYLLDYFGDQAPWERCGDCDACREGRRGGSAPRALQPDEDLVVRKVLSCVARLKKPHSAAMIARVLTGSREESVLKFGYDRLSTFGILSAFTQAEVERVVAELERAGCLQREFATHVIRGAERTYATFALTPLGREVMLQKRADFRMCYPLGARATRAASEARAPVAVARDLLQHLRDVRARLAKAEDVPAYVVAPNRTLEAMASRRPMTRKAMLEVDGMGPERLRRYGEPFLEAIRAWAG